MGNIIQALNAREKNAIAICPSVDEVEAVVFLGRVSQEGDQPRKSELYFSRKKRAVVVAFTKRGEEREKL